jgi:tetratricopeptide (TPR) repeat protein
MKIKTNLIFYALSLLAFNLLAAPPTQKELSEFYRLKSANPAKAKTKLETFLKSNPQHVAANIEMGYLLMGEKKYDEAIAYFKNAKGNSPDSSQLALQLGYIYDTIGDKQSAYQEFEAAMASSEGDIQEKACLATIYLAPARRKKLPDPYFFDVYFSPSYSSRFDNGLFSLNSRYGVNVGGRKEWDFYVGFRGTRDTASKGGNLPEIFSDNAGIFSLGVKYIPFYRVPVSLYGEAGRGYDLLRRGRPRWRDDFRAGLLAYDTWGASPRCCSQWLFPFRHVGDAYGDVGVYSRYRRNWIAYGRVREGLRLVEKGRSALDGYIHLYGVTDSNDDFYNNLFEVGPGLAWVPDHRQNVVVRVGRLRGHYFKVNGRDPNPYGSHYWDTRCDAEMYWRF